MDNPTQIAENFSAVSLENSPDERIKFCSVWPQARVGLEFLRDMIKNPIVKTTIAVVIAAGDAAVSEVCD